MDTSSRPVFWRRFGNWEELPKMQKASEELEKRKDDAEKAPILSNLCCLGSG